MLDQRTPVAGQIRGIFSASDANQAQRLLNVALKDCGVSHPKLASRAETNLPERFSVFSLSRRPSGAHSLHQWAGAIEQGTQASRLIGHALSESGWLPTIGQCTAAMAVLADPAMRSDDRKCSNIVGVISSAA